MSDLWEMAFDNGRAHWPSDDKATFAEGAEWGAGWAFAIVGMAEAIRAAHLCRSCIQIYSADSDGMCQRCGYPHGYPLVGPRT